MDSQLTVLLVEDNILNQRIATFSLKKYNHLVHIANNGLEAVEQFKKATFDIILMDIMMPKMDGLEATQRIRSIEAVNGVGKRTPIIAVTANTMDNDRDKCISHGMDEFIVKPFDVDKLNSILKRMKIMD